MRTSLWLLCVVLLWIAAGCQRPKGIYDVDSANDAAKEARLLTEEAFQKISNGVKLTEADKSNLAKAGVIYQDLIKFRPQDWGPWFELGKVQLALGDNRKAEESLKQFLVLAEGQEHVTKEVVSDAHFLLGSAFLRMDRADDALVEARKALETDPDNPTYLVLLARANIGLKKTDEARKQLVEIIKLYPDAQEPKQMLKDLNKAEL